jgi:putative two-component system response regulator
LILLNALKARHLHEDEIADWDFDLVGIASQLHDVGKIYINDAILRKPGKLTPEEFAIMKHHTDFGNSIIDRIESITPPNELTMHAKIFAGFHHERWDGKGYPLSLSGEDIPLQGRIMAIADVYDALVSLRPYKEPMPHEKAVSIIKEGSGTQFDPTLVKIFLEEADQFKEFYKARINQRNTLVALLNDIQGSDYAEMSGLS